MKWGVAAASAAATAVASYLPFSTSKGTQSTSTEDGRRRKPAAEDRFAPRFDGLRFIETLVTAHR